MSTQLNNMGTELQSQNCVDVDYEENTVRIYLKSFGTFSKILYCIFFCYCCFLSFICILNFNQAISRPWDVISDLTSFQTILAEKHMFR